MPTIFLNKNQYASNGGKEMVLTQTQYDNLSEQDKMNGMTYYICDADSDKNGDFQPVIYSTSEREVGVWCDGKPLYQKTISFTIPSNNWDYFDIASDIDTVIDYTGVVKDHNNSFQHIFFNRYDSANTTFYTTVVVQNGDKKLFFRTYIAMNNCIAYVTIRYTKTTDAAGSGSWTPGGMPAHHYNDTEKVIGTWNGETLYEKTITISSFSATTSEWGWYAGQTSISSIIPNIKQSFPIVEKSYITLTDTTTRQPCYIDCQTPSSPTIYFPGAGRSGTLTLTIQYTKTTT